jgi:hypothetical protein
MKFILLLLVGFPLSAEAQTDSLGATEDIRKFQRELNDEFSNKKETPLEPKQLKKFKGLPFFNIDLKYRVTAELAPATDTTFFKMAATGAVVREYRRYAVASFSIDGQLYHLTIYQSKSLMKKEGYEDYLFLPFMDLTNGERTYEAGRYINLRIPKDDRLVLDFNQAYNPYCAYSHRFSCPIVPMENHLDVAIPAGVGYEETMKSKK